ncbi:MAG: S49 family peptidase [Nitrospiraceae bacterium]|nr:S49 family peptidase [Nitrospiraceae bacterium]
MKKDRHRVSHAFFGSPLALLSEKRAEIKNFLEAWESGAKIDDLAPFQPARANSRLPLQKNVAVVDDSPTTPPYSDRYSVINGVAVLPVYDVIGPRMNMLMWFSGGTSLELLTQDFIEARDRADVHSILMDFDTPGGDASNLSNLSDIIFASRGTKPVIAVVNPSCYSGGYWLASACDKVFMASTTAGAGSIGVVVEHRDYSGQQKMRGVVTTEVYAGKYKRIASNYKPLTDEGKAYLQDRADYVYSLFVDEVARNRGVSAKKVLSAMAEGRIFMGQQAVDAGLADGIESFDIIIDRLVKGDVLSGQKVYTKAPEGVSTENEEEIVVNAENLKSKFPDVYQSVFNTGVEEGRKQQKPASVGAMTFGVSQEGADGNLAIEALQRWKNDPTLQMKFATAADFYEHLLQVAEFEKNPPATVIAARKRAGLPIAEEAGNPLIEDARSRQKRKGGK